MVASFHQLEKYFTPSSYTYDPYTPMYEPNSGGIYEAENSINIQNKVDELSQKLDHLLNMRHSPTSPCMCMTYVRVPTTWLVNIQLHIDLENLYMSRLTQPQLRPIIITLTPTPTV